MPRQSLRTLSASLKQRMLNCLRNPTEHRHPGEGRGRAKGPKESPVPAFAGMTERVKVRYELTPAIDATKRFHTNVVFLGLQDLLVRD